MTDERPDWQRDREFSNRVHAQMRLGFGVEDIAGKLNCPVDEAIAAQQARARLLGGQR